MSFAARAGNVLPWALLGALVIAGAAVPAVAPVRAPAGPLGAHVRADRTLDCRVAVSVAGGCRR
ncbi:MAG: hypothetical protein ABSB70_07810 [Candidatus Velthaea sp.]